MDRRTDPANPASFNHQYEKTNGIRLHFVDEGNLNGPLIFLVHGFPDIWYGWRFQISFLASLGFRIVVPDMRGYGETETRTVLPGDRHALEFFTWKSVSGDLAALIDFINDEPHRRKALKIKKGKGTAIFLGHDWYTKRTTDIHSVIKISFANHRGGVTVFRMAMHHPTRVSAVISLCVTYYPPFTSYMPLQKIVKHNPQFQYHLWFAADYGTVEFINANTETFIDTLFTPAPEPDEKLPRLTGSGLDSGDGKKPRSVLESGEVHQFYVDTFKRTGFQGGLNYYKTRFLNYMDELNMPAQYRHPVLFIAGSDDPALPVSMARSMPKFIPDLTMEALTAGHWVQVEQHDGVNKMIREWLDRKGMLPASVTNAKPKL
ncbi:Alpha/Beta hydrolase protein [Cladochytrium replicatum]|nr:Alpha/Beta hydrolase protein [Cladochytrium replicatum]